MKIDSLTCADADETTAAGVADGWVPLLDEPPPLDWGLEDLFVAASTEQERAQPGEPLISW